MSKVVDFPVIDAQIATEKGRVDEYIRSILDGIEIDYESEDEREWVEAHVFEIYRPTFEATVDIGKIKYPETVSRRDINIIMGQYRTQAGAKLRMILYNAMKIMIGLWIRIFRLENPKQ